MKKKEAIGVWFDPLKFKPTDIEDYREGDYVVMKVMTTEHNWDYKLGWYHREPGRWRFHVINEPGGRYSIVGWTVVPEFDLITKSDIDFYKYLTDKVEDLVVDEEYDLLDNYDFDLFFD